MRRFIVVYATVPPQLHMLSAGACELYDQRTACAGSDKARMATFGNDSVYAFPVNDAMLCYIMERATADGVPYAAECEQMAIRLAQGLPVGDGKDLTEGGLRVATAPPVPRKPRPGGVAQLLPASGAAAGGAP